ncbi:hypothetical protein Hanom_Chr00s016067g01755541 [Helianthus anomalus]
MIKGSDLNTQKEKSVRKIMEKKTVEEKMKNLRLENSEHEDEDEDEGDSDSECWQKNKDSGCMLLFFW